MRSTERDPSVSMVGRVADIFDTFTAQDDQLSISEIARRSGLAKSTVSRIATELIEHQFLERDGSGVRLGLRLFELGETATRPRDLRRLALASMSDLRSAVHLTVHLAVLEGAEVVYIEILAARSIPQLPSRIGGRMPAYATGVGKALLAWSEADIVDEILDGEFIKMGPNTVTDPAKLRRELTRVRESGVAYEREESARGVACAAAVIRNASGDPIAAMSATGWAKDIDVRRIGPAVHTAAQAVSRLAGRRPGLRL